MTEDTETTATETALDPETEALLNRLRRIEGQIRGIHRMLAENRVCEDVVTQLMAARSSLDPDFRYNDYSFRVFAGEE